MADSMKIQYTPLNDQVLIKMDIKQKSILETGINTRPTVLPSGYVIAVGKGVFLQGVGWAEPQVKPGDHVAVAIEGWTTLPLAEDANDVYVSVSESVILGKLEGATPDSPWFKLGEDTMGGAAAGAQLARITGGRR